MTKGEILESISEVIEEKKKRGLWANIHAKRKRGEKPAKPGDDDYPDKKGWDKAVKSSKVNETETDEIKIKKSEKITDSDISSLIDEIANIQIGYGVIDELVLSKLNLKNKKLTVSSLTEIINEALTEYYSMTETLNEAEYKGRKVKLGKISKGDTKKFKVHVKNAKGNVVKVEFGDPNMEIKRDDPKRKKSFRARHRCSEPGPRWKARYWSCKMWSNKKVSDLT